MDISESLFSALVKVGECLVVDAHEVQDGGVDVVNCLLYTSDAADE